MTDKVVVTEKNLAVRVASDPTLMKFYSRLKDPHYRIPSEYEDDIKKLRGVKSTEKGVLVSKVTTPEDYQTQLAVLSAIQHCLDRIHEINTDLYIVHARWKELLGAASRAITLAYFDELNELKDGVRKTVISVALQPVQDGLDKIQALIDMGELTHKHLTATNFNIKEGTEIITQYLSMFKFGSSVRVPTEV
jgi:3D (Asp-Asp-Asp) domain-containing protein